jgi:Ni/Fe-hydrogenase subunit HybB-like protein
MCVNVFFILMELFTALYSGIPDHIQHLEFLYLGIAGNNSLAPWMWVSAALAIVSLIFLLIPNVRNNQKTLFVICIAVFLSIGIEKGFGLVITGFIPNELGKVVHYWPTIPETFIALGIWAIGFFLITIFYKILLSVRREI